MVESKEYILMARRGFFNEALRELAPVVESKGPHAPFVVKSMLAGGRDIRVIHSTAANGPKLVELDELAAREVDRHPDVRRLPVVEYPKPFPIRRLSGESGSFSSASYPICVPRPKPQQGSGVSRSAVTIRVKEKKKGRWVSAGSGLMVTAFSNLAAEIGDEKVTDNSGKVIMRLSGNTIERLYCPKVWGWGAFRKNIPLKSSFDLELEPVSVDFTDCVRRYYGESRFDPRTGVTVGVLDTGVGPHKDLNIVGGLNTVTGEPDDVYQDSDFHGTFVAGLIGSRGNLYPSMRGLAPGVKIRSYRIFGVRVAKSYALMNAIIQAQAQTDQCDILNLSIEDGIYDENLQEAIIGARDNGMLVVVAAGNDGRKAVNYPAAYPGATAVSAMGCEGTFPSGALEETTVNRPPTGTNDPKEFIAAFSNAGDQISVTGLGVGVLSTLPDDQYGSCSGTSFAAPVVTGAVASLLSQNPSIYYMPRNRARSDAIEQLLFNNCITRGFGPRFEGHGMPDPRKV
jgi:hypothetical protein